MPDLGGAHAARLAILDQRHVGRGAADVERQDVLEAGILGDPHRAGDAAGRPGHQQCDGMLFRFVRRHQAAIRPQQRQAAVHFDLLELRAQVADIAADDRAHRGIGDGGQRALIFLHLGQHDMAERERDIGQDLRRQLGDAQLVRGVEIGIDQRDGERLDAHPFERLERSANVGIVGRTELLSLRADAALDLDRVLQPRHRFWLGPDDPAGEAAGDEAARDLHNLAIALGRDETDARALAFEHGIGGNRGAVQEIVDVRRRQTSLGAQRLDAIENAFRAVVRGRGCLVSPEIPGVVAEQQQIGERAADVDAHAVAHSQNSLISARGNPPARLVIPGSGRPITPVSHVTAAIMRSSESPVATPLRWRR